VGQRYAENFSECPCSIFVNIRIYKARFCDGGVKWKRCKRINPIMGGCLCHKFRRWDNYHLGQVAYLCTNWSKIDCHSLYEATKELNQLLCRSDMHLSPRRLNVRVKRGIIWSVIMCWSSCWYMNILQNISLAQSHFFPNVFRVKELRM